MYYYRVPRDWIKVYGLSMGAGSQVYNSIINQGSPKTWNIEKCIGNRCPKFFRHPFLDMWEALAIDKVKLVLYAKDVVVVEMVFDGRNSSVTSWFSIDRLQLSPWTDLKPGKPNHFSMIGIRNGRRFYVSKLHEGCPGDYGWLSIGEKNLGCQWETSHPFPNILYATNDVATRWETGYGVADEMAIFIHRA